MIALIAMQSCAILVFVLCETPRASITIRQLDDDLKRRLRLRAARNGRSMEEEVRTIVRGVAVAEGPPEPQPREAPRQAADALRLPSAPIDRTLADRRVLLII